MHILFRPVEDHQADFVVQPVDQVEERVERIHAEAFGDVIHALANELEVLAVRELDDLDAIPGPGNPAEPAFGGVLTDAGARLWIAQACQQGIDAAFE